MAEQGPSPVLFFDTINAYQRTESLRAAIELGLFTRIAAGERTAEQIAAACQASPRGCLYLRGVLADLPEGRLSSQRALRASADGAAGGDFIQVREVSAIRVGLEQGPISLCF